MTIRVSRCWGVFCFLGVKTKLEIRNEKLEISVARATNEKLGTSVARATNEKLEMRNEKLRGSNEIRQRRVKSK